MQSERKTVPFDELPPVSSDPRSETMDDWESAAHFNVDAAIDAGLPIDSSSQVVVVDFRSGEAVHLHPAISPHLEEGWRLRRAVPRLIDGRVKMLVVLQRREKYLS